MSQHPAQIEPAGGQPEAGDGVVVRIPAGAESPRQVALKAIPGAMIAAATVPETLPAAAVPGVPVAVPAAVPGVPEAVPAAVPAQVPLETLPAAAQVVPLPPVQQSAGQATAAQAPAPQSVVEPLTIAPPVALQPGGASQRSVSLSAAAGDGAAAGEGTVVAAYEGERGAVPYAVPEAVM